MKNSSTDQLTELELWPCEYRVKCKVPGCRNLARVIVRRIAQGGAPEGQSEFCNKDARASVDAARVQGVPVHDNAAVETVVAKSPRVKSIG